jgi:hypothetical protein
VFLGLILYQVFWTVPLWSIFLKFML